MILAVTVLTSNLRVMVFARYLPRHANNYIPCRCLTGQNGSRKIGFIGLGNMGSNMCKNLINKKFDVIAKDVSGEREKIMESDGAKIANSLKEITEQADCIITMLPASQHLLDLYQSHDGLIKHLRSGTVAVDCSTVDFTTSVALGKRLNGIGVPFIDAPVSGGVPAAAKGALTFMVGGEEATLKNVEPILMSMGSKIFHCGPLGSGQITKMCNNLLLAISAAGVSEIFNLGVRLGIKPELLTSVINSSSGRCWVTDTYHPVPHVFENVPSSNDYKAGFTSEMILKDLKIAEKAAADVNCPLRLGLLVTDIYKNICESGRKQKDFTYVYEHFKNMRNKDN